MTSLMTFTLLLSFSLSSPFVQTGIDGLDRARQGRLEIHQNPGHPDGIRSDMRIQINDHPHSVIVSFESHSGVKSAGKRFVGPQPARLYGINNALERLPVREIRNLPTRHDSRFLQQLEERAAAAHPGRSFDLSRHFVIEFPRTFDGRTIAKRLRDEEIITRSEISRAYPPPYHPRAACVMVGRPRAERPARMPTGPAERTW